MFKHYWSSICSIQLKLTADIYVTSKNIVKLKFSELLVFIFKLFQWSCPFN